MSRYEGKALRRFSEKRGCEKYGVEESRKMNLEASSDQKRRGGEVPSCVELLEKRKPEPSVMILSEQ